jgi:alpha-amylase/alpha-mannosidase (GH57 family)
VEQGLFIDYFVDQAEIDDLRAGILPRGIPVFANTVYQDVSLDSSRHEIQLKTNGYFGAFQQPLSLRKQYSFRNEGIQVQYILKNDSPLALSGNFLIELDLAVTRTRQHEPLMTVYAHDQRADSRITEGQFDDVSWIQLSDLDSGVRFTVDANENPSVSVLPITCSGSSDEGAPARCEGTRLFLSWKVDLGPGYEMEKMVFLKIDA